jgi:O-antigen ligase
MISYLRQTRFERQWWWYALILAVPTLAAVFGSRPSVLWLAIPIGLASALILLRHPLLGFFGLILAALLAKVDIGTGTEVTLNPAVLVVPAIIGVWMLTRVQGHSLDLVRSRANLPLALFLLSGLLSIAIGNATWDPFVPRAANFTLVQIAQWAMFAFSAAMFWLVGSMFKSEVWLRRLTACFLIVGGGLAIVRMLPGGSGFVFNTMTYAVNRAPFWLLLTALAAGQLLYNRQLSTKWRIYLVIVLGAILMYSFGDQKERASNWVCVAVVVGVLVWLRIPRVRWMTLIVIAALTVSGVLSQFVYDFAGGDAKWEESGGSRLALSGAVIKLAMRNPITGLGPAAYRPYGKVTALQYEHVFYSAVFLSAHNNYVDLFAHQGIIGLGLFLWFMVELALRIVRLRKRYREGFAGGYINSMLAAWVSIMVIMALADWFLPFVYNIGFLGFQASILLWMFFGGVLAYERLAQTQTVPSH